MINGSGEMTLFLMILAEEFGDEGCLSVLPKTIDGFFGEMFFDDDTP